MCCHNGYETLQGLAPGLSSFQLPFGISVVLLSAGSLWVVVLDVPVLQNGSNGSTDSVKSFFLLLEKPGRCSFLVSHSSEKHFTRWKRQGAWRTAAF